jgi:hypothetical protein
VVLYAVGAITVAMAAIVVFGETFTDEDVPCRATPASILWGEGADRTPQHVARSCRTAAEDDVVGSALIVGLGAVAVGAGVGCRRAGRARATEARTPTIASPPGATTLKLGHGVLSAAVTVSSDGLSLRMPSYLGRQPWVIPLSAITVVDTETAADEVDDVVLASPLTLPGFYRAPAFPGRNLVLLFRSPLRIPPLRHTAFGQDVGISPRRTRSRSGTDVDGIVLGFRNRADAVAALREVGATFTPSLWSWARTHRAVVHDPIQRERIVRLEAWTGRLSVVGPAVLFGSALWLRVDESSVWPLLLAPFAGVAIAAAWAIRRWLDRTHPGRGVADET